MLYPEGYRTVSLPLSRAGRMICLDPVEYSSWSGLLKTGNFVLLLFGFVLIYFYVYLTLCVEVLCLCVGMCVVYLPDACAFRGGC